MKKKLLPFILLAVMIGMPWLGKLATLPFRLVEWIRVNGLPVEVSSDLFWLWLIGGIVIAGSLYTAIRERRFDPVIIACFAFLVFFFLSPPAFFDSDLLSKRYIHWKEGIHHEPETPELPDGITADELPIPLPKAQSLGILLQRNLLIAKTLQNTPEQNEAEMERLIRKMANMLGTGDDIEMLQLRKELEARKRLREIQLAESGQPKLEEEPETDEEPSFERGIHEYSAYLSSSEKTEEKFVTAQTHLLSARQYFLHQLFDQPDHFAAWYAWGLTWLEEDETVASGAIARGLMEIDLSDENDIARWMQIRQLFQNMPETMIRKKDSLEAGMRVVYLYTPRD